MRCVVVSACARGAGAGTGAATARWQGGDWRGGRERSQARERAGASRVLVRPLEQDGARERVARALDKRKRILAELLLVHALRVAEVVGGEVVERVDRHPAAREG
jgi:hypothetical protein